MEKKKRQTILAVYQSSKLIDFLSRLIALGFIISCLYILIGSFVWLPRPSTLEHIGIVVAMIFLINVTIHMHFDGAETRLTIYKKGIELRQGPIRYFTSWENIGSLGFADLNRHVYGIHLKEEVTADLDGFLGNIITASSEKFLRLNWRFTKFPKTFFIDLGERYEIVDETRILETKLGGLLFENAPHLFGAEEKLKNQLEDGGKESLVKSFITEDIERKEDK